MFMIPIVVFLAVFAVIVVVFLLAGAGANQQQEQILQRLESINMAANRRPEDEGLNILRQELLSTVPWLNRWLQQVDPFPRLRGLLIQADIGWTLTGLLTKCLAAAAIVTGAVYWRTGIWLFSAVMGLAGAAGPILFVYYKRAQRFAQFEQKLPEALDLMVGALRAGHSLISAIEMVVKEMPNPISAEFKKCFDEQNFGLELREAMVNLASRVPLHDLHIAVTAILIQKESGGNLAEILEKVASVLRDRFRLRRQVRVHTAQGRLTGWILTVLPIVLGVGLYVMNPEYMSRLWQDPTGLKLMYVAGGLTLAGGLIIRNIIRIRV